VSHTLCEGRHDWEPWFQDTGMLHRFCKSCDGERWMDPVDAASEVDELRRWKEEATVVIGQWEKVWEHLGQPGALGEDKSLAAADEVDRLQLEVLRRGEVIATHKQAFDRERVAEAIKNAMSSAATWGECLAAADAVRALLEGEAP